MASAEPAPTEGDVAVQLRQLALVDRVLGLEAEVARLSSSGASSEGAREQIERLQAELRAVYGSRTWRIGSAVLKPLRLLRRRS
jgi:hypothetical protein